MFQKFSTNNIDEFFSKQKEKKTSHMGAIIKEIDSNIILFKRDNTLAQRSKVLEKESNTSSKTNSQCLHLSIVLDGQTNYKSELSSYCNSVKTNETSITLENKEEGTGYLTNDMNFKKVGLLIKKDFLDKNLLNKLKNQDNLRRDYSNSITNILSHQKTSLQTSILANEIFNSPFEGDLNSIFLKSKAYEIIYHEFKDLLCQNNDIKDAQIRFSKDDIAALHLAKQLITQDQQYLSLTKLSRAVALNEFKLKVGFRKLFNISVGNMVIEQKMYQSKHLLANGELNITEISKMMGYKYPSNFTNAFKKYFGKSPRELMKDRKYYI